MLIKFEQMGMDFDSGPRVAPEKRNPCRLARILFKGSTQGGRDAALK